MKNGQKTATNGLPVLRDPLMWVSLGASLLVWVLGAYLRSKDGPVFNGPILAKGTSLLILGALLYRSAYLRRDLWTFLLPMVWLASSRALWEIASMPEGRFFSWLLLFLVSLVLTLWVRDRRILLGVQTLMWGGLDWLFKISFLLPFSFLGLPVKKRDPLPWIRWGGLAVAGVWFLILQGRYYLQWNFEDAWDLWIGGRAAVFLLLGLMAPVGKMNLSFPLVRLNFVFLVLGGWIWGGEGLIGLWQGSLLTWVAVLFAGFGWESVRRELLGEEWFQQAMGFAIGLALWGSVL
ncbi:MAG TPA: hypothetical protein VHE12_06095 [bacterium]|nr:hypothetical protein [bacterium]